MLVKGEGISFKIFEELIAPEFNELRRLAQAGEFTDFYFKLKDSFFEMLKKIRVLQETGIKETYVQEVIHVRDVEMSDDEKVELREKFRRLVKDADDEGG